MTRLNTNFKTKRGRKKRVGLSGIFKAGKGGGLWGKKSKASNLFKVKRRGRGARGGWVLGGKQSTRSGPQGYYPGPGLDFSGLLGGLGSLLGGGHASPGGMPEHTRQKILMLADRAERLEDVLQILQLAGIAIPGPVDDAAIMVALQLVKRLGGSGDRLKGMMQE